MFRLLHPGRGFSRRFGSLILAVTLVYGLVPPLAASADPLVDIVFSLWSDRSWPEELDEATITEEIFVFATSSETSVDHVSLWLDDPTMAGSPARTDDSAPFDLVGGSPTKALAWDVGSLDVGQHTVTVKFEYPSLADQVIHATFLVDTVDAVVRLSDGPDRTPSSELGGEVSGDLYTFVAEHAAIGQVSFWIDDEEMSGDPDRLDDAPPFDLVGGDALEADPFDTTLLPDGGHTITVLVEIDGLDNKEETAWFEVANGVVLDVFWSTEADRSDPDGLEWREVSGEIFVFLQPDDPSIDQVSFWIDDEAMSGAAVRVDTESPFDLVGGDEEEADPFDSSTLGLGEHLLTVKVEAPPVSRTVLVC